MFKSNLQQHKGADLKSFQVDKSSLMMGDVSKRDTGYVYSTECPGEFTNNSVPIK